MDDPLALAESYLHAVRRGESGNEAAAALRNLSRQGLADALDTDSARLTFWINLYNAAAQSVLTADPSVFEARNAFFSAPLVTVAGHSLSLDAIEHGLLRRSRPKWGFGYVPNPFPNEFEQQFRVSERDPRIHFALNCGAASCPPIAAYETDHIDEQLDLATRGYLDSEVHYDPERKQVRVPRLMLWFIGDFGGLSGIRRFLSDHGTVPSDSHPRIRFSEYDWTLEAGQFASLSEWGSGQNRR